eukprot:TRINITY_DN3726_c0_g1_i2.p1 TRINITY_DN3726_c0_g1~~TRINITY_DN3726_c0_g1_i2.p1  ORF type:complete len:740 (-),score=157.92 TRINITY_DN3726_c0_g1_i2:28-2247(-)
MTSEQPAIVVTNFTSSSDDIPYYERVGHLVDNRDIYYNMRSQKPKPKHRAKPEKVDEGKSGSDSSSNGDRSDSPTVKVHKKKNRDGEKKSPRKKIKKGASPKKDIRKEASPRKGKRTDSEGVRLSSSMKDYISHDEPKEVKRSNSLGKRRGSVSEESDGIPSPPRNTQGRSIYLDTSGFEYYSDNSRDTSDDEDGIIALGKQRSEIEIKARKRRWSFSSTEKRVDIPETKKRLSADDLLKYVDSIPGFLDSDRFKQVMLVREEIEQKIIWKEVTIPEDPCSACVDLKFLIRKGIPLTKMGETWLSITGKTWKMKTGKLPFDHHEITHQEIFGDRLPEILKPPLFGANPLDEVTHLITLDGIKACKRILVLLGMDFPTVKFCPVLPDLVCYLLAFLDESQAFHAVTSLFQDALNEENRDFTHLMISKRSEIAFVKTFEGCVKHHIPEMYRHMKKIKMKITPIFQEWSRRLFVTALPYHLAVHVFSAYLNEGLKVIFRVGLAILFSLLEPLLETETPEEFEEVLGSSKKIYDLDNFMKTAFSFHIRTKRVVQLHLQHWRKLEDIQEPAHTYYRPKIKTPSQFFDEEIFEHIYENLPSRHCIKDPYLIFNSREHGTSLISFHQRLYKASPIFIVIKTFTCVFGIFVPYEWKVDLQESSETEMFIMKLMPDIQTYTFNPKSKAVSVAVQSDNIRFGVSSNGCAIYIDKEWNCITEPSSSFNCDAINGTTDPVVVLGVEVFTFK